jgi:hypothetical protein
MLYALLHNQWCNQMLLGILAWVDATLAFYTS